MSRKYYTVNPTWFKGYRPDLTKDVIVFGEDNDQAKTDSCLAILWYPTGPKLDADFDEWALLSHERTLLDLLAGAGLTHGKDLTVEQVCEILEVCGFEEEKCIPNPGKEG